MLETILIVVLVLFLIGALPNWPHSRGWGYMPSVSASIALVAVIALLVAGRM